MNVSATLPSGTVGTSFSASTQVTGGTAPYTFSISSGSLPSGVNLNYGTGQFSGTPSASGTFSFSLFVSDSKADSAEKALQITVANPPPATTGSGGSSGGGSSNNGGGNSGSGTSGSGSSGGNSGGSGTSNSPSSNAGTTFPNLQKVAGWGQFGQGPPSFVDCSPSPCDGISFSMNQNVSSPSMSGAATEFNLGGSTPYSDGLWNNHMIGPLSSQGTFDSDGTLTPSLHNFTYDVYFFASDFSPVQALEFDINQFFDNMGFIFGHECRIASGNQWDVWDAQNAKWIPTGVPCYPNNNAWNHVTLKVQRTSDNHITYQSITFNGQTYNLNWSYGYGSAPGWYGVTINYQMDGNFQQTPYAVYLDNLNFTFD